MQAWSHFQADWTGKKVLVYGVGRQGGGSGVANTFAQAGALVRIYDQQSPTALAESIAQLNPAVDHTYTPGTVDYDWPELVVKNPGVPDSQPDIVTFQQRGIPVLSETAIALKYAATHTIGITGTRGKTTTTNLIYHILQTAGWPVVMGGNQPHQPSLALLPELTDDTWLVLELSSFQLESLASVKVSPQYSVITNIYPDHLNRYHSLDEYAQAKAKIFMWQPPGGQVWLGTHHEWYDFLRQLVPTTSQLHTLTPMMIDQLAQRFPHPQLIGTHNDENVAFAVAVAQAIGVADNVIATAVRQFAGVPFRLQTVGQMGPVRIINDTTASTPTALEKALDALAGEKIVLLAGGTSKHLPFTPSLLEKLHQQPAAIVWLPGSGTTELLAALGQTDIPTYDNLAAATAAALAQAQQQQATILLFSPGFTSFEMFNNEFERGAQFNDQIAKLGGSPPETL
jgi:UDP-N-acetylmuramoylalanine--D-glutamate ligase